MNMNTRQKHLLDFVRRMNLSILMFEELEDQDSPLVSFINSFTLNYIIFKLKKVNRQEFISLLEQETSEEKVWQFIRKHIKNFDGDYQEELEKRLKKLRNKVVGNNKKQNYYDR